MTTEILPNSYLELVQTGVASSLPTTPNVAPSGKFFVLYYATDTNVLYVWNTSTAAWVAKESASPVNKTALFTAAAVSASYTLDAVAGFVVTLPAATGSGNTLEFIVKTTLTSGAYEISAAGTDTLAGTIVANKGTTPTPYQATLGTSVNVTLTFTTVGGGIKGDRIRFKDVLAGVWEVDGLTWVTGTVATPFS